MNAEFQLILYLLYVFFVYYLVIILLFCDKYTSFLIIKKIKIQIYRIYLKL